MATRLRERRASRLVACAVSVAVASASITAPAVAAPTVEDTTTQMVEAANQVVDTPIDTVRAIDVVGGTAYLGGDFTSVGANTGGGAVVSTATAAVNRSFPPVNGTVYAVAPDGGGGYYIGGEFSAVGGEIRSNTARILPNGEVDPVWKPRVFERVNSLLVSGSSVYLGGNFASIDGVTRMYAAQLDRVTGVVRGWDPKLDGSVNAMAISGSMVYLGGGFDNVNGTVKRKSIAAVDATTGNVSPWQVTLPHSSNVTEIVVSDTAVYFSGYFDSVNQVARSGIASVSASTGQLRPLNPVVNDRVLSMALTGTKLYLGGSFTKVNGTTRNRAAAIDIATGELTAWNPNVSGSALPAVNVLLQTASTIYLGGSFTSLNGSSQRNCAGAVDAVTGQVLDWHPNVAQRLDGALGPTVDEMVLVGSQVYVGGWFTHVNVEDRFHAAAIDDQGMLTDWAPNVDGPVNAVKVAGSSVYLGGSFTKANVTRLVPASGGVSRSNAAAFDPVTGLAKPWDPSFNGAVRDLLVSGSTVYVVGDFTYVHFGQGGSAVMRNRAAAVDATSGVANTWNPNLDADVATLDMSGSTVYLGGEFTSVNGGVARLHAAAVDAGTALATPWDPRFDGFVHALVVADDLVYVAGSFDTVNDSTSRSGVAAVDTGLGVVTDWDPKVTHMGVADIAVSGTTVYVAGSLWRVNDGAVQRSLVAAFDAGTGVALSWDPAGRKVAVGSALAVYATDTMVYVGGVFSRMANHLVTPIGSHFARLVPAGVAEFVPMAPVRVVDTRADSGLPLNRDEVIVVNTSDDVPIGTTAIAFNVTVTGQSASGYVDVAPEGAPPGSSTVNWSRPFETIANGHIAKLSANRTFQITLESVGTAHVILDVTGYFAPIGTAQGAVYQAANRRIYDSRTDQNPLPPGASRVLNINTGGTAAAVAPSAAAVNVTATGTVGSGVLTVARDRSTTTSTINWTGPAQTLANAVITDVAPNGEFTVTNNGQTPAHVVVDLTGTFAPTDAGGTGARFYAVDPRRTYDSRFDPAGKLNGGQSRTTSSPVPDDAVAVVLNATITGTEGTGYLAVTPLVAGVPTTSTVNWYTSLTTRANGSIISTDAGENRSYVGGNFSTHYLFDLAGYFR